MGYTQGQGQTVGEGIPAAPSKPMLRKGLWAPEEDEKLINYIKKNGNLGSWSYVAKQAGLHRCGRSCRLRWINYLRPGLKRGPFSYREERLIIRLQSIFGNRWSLIAAHLPGRTDNDLKNYWNSCISKKLKLKHHLSSSSTNNKSDILSKSITNSVSVHANNPFTLSHSSQQCFDVIPEGFQPPNNSFNVVTTEQNSLCVQGVLELKHGQLQDESDLEFSIDPDPTKNKQISYPNQWINASSINTGESFSSPADFISPSLHTKSSTCDQLLVESYRTTLTPHDSPPFADFSLGSTGISIPGLVESESSKEKVGNDENLIMIDDSNAWSATHPYSNGTDCSQVVVPGVYSSYEAEISILENENTTHQSCPPLDLRSQFSCPACQFSEIHPENDCTHRLNLSYDVNMGVPTYMGISSRFERNELPGIEEAIKANQITTLGKRIGNGPFQTGADQNKAWPHDNMYNINPASPSDLDHIYFT